MPDGMNFAVPDDTFGSLAQQADLALAYGDEERCIELIAQIYELFDCELAN